jgi:hypothetical protein
MVKPPRVRRRAGLTVAGLLTVIVSMLAFRRAERGRRAEALSPDRQRRASG